MLDLRGVKCPISIMRFRKWIKEQKSGETVVVVCDDVSFVTDITAYCNKAGLAVNREVWTYKVTLP